MALQSIKGGFPFPAWPTGVNQGPSLSAITLDASGEKAAAIWRATAAKAIRKVHLRLGAVTTGDTVDVRVETVDTASTGDPTGTLWASAGSANASLVVGSGDDNTWKSVTLTNDTNALAIGDVFALVVVNGAVGNMTLSAYGDQSMVFPYSDLFAAAAWTKDDNPYVIVPEYSDGSFEPILGYTGVGAPINTNTFDSDDTTNRRGNIFQIAFPARASGAWAWIDHDAAFSMKVYDAAGTSVLATTPVANAFQRGITTPGIVYMPFAAPVELAAGTNYRIAIVPDIASNIVTYDFDVPVAGMLDMFPGGQACHRSVYTSSAWVETTTSRSYLGVFLDQFDDGTAVGGSGGNANIFGGSVIK